MKTNVIKVNNLTKDYGHGRGVFQVSLQVQEGECYGFLGPNGAGKTTTIRHLMGFSKPQSGTVTIQGLDCWKDADKLKPNIGYLPGEIAFPKGMKGDGFLSMMEHMRKNKNSYVDTLLERFELDPSMAIHQMSLGMRRKLAVVTAFMHDPAILILDEPTSGLDPLMQQQFIDFILDEKKRGKTILLSSHIFHEVDATCDRISIIRNGRIAADFDAEQLKNRSQRTYRITLETSEGYQKFCQFAENSLVRQIPENRTATIATTAEKTPALMEFLFTVPVVDFEEIPFTLEDYFMHFYDKQGDGADVAPGNQQDNQQEVNGK